MLQPQASGVQPAGQKQKRSKLESALMFMNLAGSAIDITKGVSGLGKKKPGSTGYVGMV